MKKPSNKILTRLLAVIGALLVLIPAGVMAVSYFGRSGATQQTAAVVERLRSLFPPTHSAVGEGDPSAPMAVLQVDGVDYCGILELPTCQRELPLADEWSGTEVSRCPHRFTGSAYGEMLVVGGSDNRGQFDFMKIISLGDPVLFTAVDGGQFRYTVTDIYSTEDVSYEALTAADGQLVLFARNTYGLDYTVVVCQRKE